MFYVNGTLVFMTAQQCRRTDLLVSQLVLLYNRPCQRHIAIRMEQGMAQHSILKRAHIEIV